MPSERRLAAILFTDTVGSTAVTARSESAGLALRDRHRALVRTQVERYRGRFVEAPGDESLSTFESAVDAVHAALAIQEALYGDPELEVRMGLHLGETMFRGEEVFGDGVNIAARVRALAEPGQILASGEVARAVQNQPNVEVSPRGEHKLKGVEGPVMVHELTGSAAEPSATTRAHDRTRQAPGPWITAAGVLALAAVAALAWWLYQPAPASAPLTSIAVLPFDDLSPGSDQEWLAHGMAEELIESLSRVEELKVIARNSTLAMRGKDVRLVGDQLNVGSVVEGSVRRSADQLRITAQLIRVEDGSHLWSARYDRPLDDVFAVQQEIAREVAEAVRSELGVGETWSTLARQRYAPSDVRAYELVRTGADLAYASFSEEGIRQSRTYYLRALEIDPDYAQAHAALGWSHLLLWLGGHDRSAERRSEARAAALRALELDPTNGHASELLVMLSINEASFADAERLVKQALVNSPADGGLHARYADILAETGRLDAALLEAQRTVELDPLQAARHAELGRIYLMARQYDKAIETLERSLELNPAGTGSITRAILSQAYHFSGNDAAALEASLAGWPREHHAALRKTYDAGGYEAVVRVTLEAAIARDGRACTAIPGVGAHAYGMIGETDKMFSCIEQARAEQSVFGLFLKASPTWDPYRDDPRFIALLKQMNLDD
jgi:TolB-like protein/class 3 adenylate cyclase/Tfp pilus assembly protein PilF